MGLPPSHSWMTLCAAKKHGGLKATARSRAKALLAFWAKTWNCSDGEGAPMAAKEKIDWSECPLVEVKPGVQSGAPVLLGTRMPVNAIADNFDYGVSVDEIVEQFEVPPDRIEAILTYAKRHRIAHRI